MTMPQKKKNRKQANIVESTKHKDKRKNIPTAELQDFVKEDEIKPKKILYPRDPSLDPQLVWKGKDEQDQKPLEVPAVPIYIQEKIHPQVLIEDLRKTYPPSSPLTKEGQRGVDWRNMIVFGDNLQFLKTVYKNKSHLII